jgi:cytochrome P450
VFTRRAIAGYATLMAEEASAAAARWVSGAGAGATDDVHVEMTRLTLRVVGRAIFGDDVDEARDVMRSAFPLVTRRAIRRATSPVSLPAWWPTPANVRAARARRDLYAVVDGLIARRKAAGAGGEGIPVLHGGTDRRHQVGKPMTAGNLRHGSHGAGTDTRA